MTIVPMSTRTPAAPVEIPLTADCFRVDPENCESLILKSPAVIEAFRKAVNCEEYDMSGEVTLDFDLWSDSVPYMNAEATEFSRAWFNFDGLWIAAVALTDEEINLVLLSAYPELAQADNAVSFNEAVEIEQWKSQQIAKDALRTHLNAV